MYIILLSLQNMLMTIDKHGTKLILVLLCKEMFIIVPHSPHFLFAFSIFPIRVSKSPSLFSVKARFCRPTSSKFHDPKVECNERPLLFQRQLL